MVAGWMLYFVLVSALMLGAGLLLEEAARRMGWAQRWIWAAAVAGSALMPLAARMRPAPPPSGAAVPIGTMGESMVGPVTLLRSDLSGGWLDAVLPSLDPILLALWGGASALLLLLVAISMVRLRRAVLGWRDAGLGEPRVLISERTGPAVVGLFRGSIVLPEWAASGDPEVRQLMLTHEGEHLRARDPALLMAAHLLVVLLPWNLPLWWQLRRLHLAVEVDCDARVLRGGSNLRSYATLLLEVGRRQSGLSAALLAFAEPTSFLERRIRIMTSDRRRKAWIVALGLAMGAVALVAGACGVDQPEEPPAETLAADSNVRPAVDDLEEEEVRAPALVETVDTAAGAATAPMEERVRELTEELRTARRLLAEARSEAAAEARDTFGYEVATLDRSPQSASAMTYEIGVLERIPQLQNESVVAASMERIYPRMLQDAGIGGTVQLQFEILPDGTVDKGTIRVISASHEQFAQVSTTIAESFQFRPGVYKGNPVRTIVTMPIAWKPSS